MHDIIIIYLCSLHTLLLCILQCCMHDMVTTYLYRIMLVYTTLLLFTYASYTYFTLSCNSHDICLLEVTSYDDMFYLLCIQLWWNMAGRTSELLPTNYAVIIWLLGTGWCLILGNRWLASEHRSELGGIHEINITCSYTSMYYDLLYFGLSTPNV